MRFLAIMLFAVQNHSYACSAFFEPVDTALPEQRLSVTELGEQLRDPDHPTRDAALYTLTELAKRSPDRYVRLLSATILVDHKPPNLLSLLKEIQAAELARPKGKALIVLLNYLRNEIGVLDRRGQFGSGGFGDTGAG